VTHARHGARPHGRSPSQPRGLRGTSYVLIGTVARRFGVHPQTLRLYEREGLILPPRSAGTTRLYDQDTVERLEIILTLTRELGVNLAGVEVILDLRSRLRKMEGEVERLMEAIRSVAAEHGGRGAERSTALVLRPRGALARRYE
jgi:MerR family transcriptional regulator/heat shock protein HspR